MVRATLRRMPSRALASTPRLPLATALVGAALVACSPGVETFDDGSGGSGASGPSTTSTSGATSSTGSTTGNFMAGSGGGMGVTTTCSGDLKQVLAEDGTVLQTCGPDEGCANGGCVPACEAAAASAGSLGCDYLLATPNFLNVILPPCFAAFVANSWDKPVKIQVSRGGQSYDVTQFGRIAQHRLGTRPGIDQQSLAVHFEQRGETPLADAGARIADQHRRQDGDLDVRGADGGGGRGSRHEP
jgi:hypothetical protein